MPAMTNAARAFKSETDGAPHLARLTLVGAARKTRRFFSGCQGGWTAGSPCTITSTGASALAVGRQGATDPTLKVDASTALSATGIKITAAAAAGGVAIAAISSGTNENITVNAKGSGTITFGDVSTGNIVLSRAMTGVSSSLSSYARFGTGNDTAADGGYGQVQWERSTTLASGSAFDWQLPDSSGKANFGLVQVTFQRNTPNTGQNRTALFLVGYDGTTTPVVLQVGSDLVSGTAGNSTFTLAGTATGQLRATYTGGQTGRFILTYIGGIGLA